MRNHPNPRRHGPLFAVLIVTALAAAGCHVNQPYEPTPPGDAAKAVQVLKSLPSFEDTKTQVQAAIDEIKATASKLIPSITWETPSEGSGDTCQQPYEQTDGRGYFLPHAVANHVTVSEQQWAKILQVTKDAAAKLDATESQVFQDKPGDHDVRFYGPARLSIGIGYQHSLVVTGYTGCRLPRDKK
jgi:hypothetical protein